MLTDFAAPPGWSPRARRERGVGSAVWEGGVWAADELRALAAALASAGGDALATLPIAARLEPWHDTVAAFLDPDSAERRRLLPALVETSGLSPEGLIEGLDLVLGGVGPAAAAALAARCAAAAGSGRRPGLGGAVLAANLPGLAVQPLLPALLSGRPLLLKTSTREPLFAAAFVAALGRRSPELARAFAAVAVPATDTAGLDAALGGAERLVAYGGEAALASLAARFGSRLVAQGPKASLALAGGELDPVGVARGLARDVARFDQRGCLSVQALYFEGPAAAGRELAEALAWALAMEHRRLPPGPIDPVAAAAVQQLRGEADLRGLHRPELPLAAGTVVVESRAEFRPSPGLRTVRVHVVERLAEVPAALAPWRGRLQGAALAGPRAEALTDELAALGICRFAAPGDLQAADAAWANGGIDPAALFA